MATSLAQVCFEHDNGCDYGCPVCNWQDAIRYAITKIERNICFDALADEDGRCNHHGGKCYELRILVNELKQHTPPVRQDNG